MTVELDIAYFSIDRQFFNIILPDGTVLTVQTLNKESIQLSGVLNYSKRVLELGLLFKNLQCCSLKVTKVCPEIHSRVFSFWSTRYIWAAPSEFDTYRLCEQRRFRRACASAQSRQNLRCSLIQAVSQEEPSDRKPDPWPFSMAGHARLKFVMTECSKTQIRLARPIYCLKRKQLKNSTKCLLTPMDTVTFIFRQTKGWNN